MCGVNILDPTNTCPLCNNVLESDGVEREKLYPDARIVTRKYQFLENVFLFASIVLWCILFAVGICTKQPIVLALLPIAGLVIYGYIRNQMMIYVEDRAFVR